MDARGRATVCATVSVSGETMEIDEAPLLTTQMRPLGASARLRGALPTGISATRLRVALSNTETESLSGLTTHTRAAPLLRGSTRIGPELRPAWPVLPSTACQKVWVVMRPSAVRALSVTW